MQGDLEAKQAIYDRFYSDNITGPDWAGYSEIIDLDGLDGLLYIAEKVGRSLEKYPDDWEDDMFISYFQNKNPDIDAISELNKSANENHYIQVYLNSVQQTLSKRPARLKPHFDNIIDKILLPKRLFIRIDVSDAEINLVAHHLLTEKNTENIRKLLFFFTKFKFPLDYTFILNIAKGKSRKNKRIVDLAIRALSLINNDEIRNFALTEVYKVKSPETLLGILKSNYKKGDNSILIHFAEKAIKETEIEELAISYIDIYKSNTTSECKQPLEIIYSKLTCAIHRCDVVEILIDNNVLSDQIRNEISFDCDEGIRQLANSA